MIIFKENSIGLQCGKLDNGKLFFSDGYYGYQMNDTPKNRKNLIKEYNFYSLNKHTKY